MYLKEGHIYYMIDRNEIVYCTEIDGAYVCVETGEGDFVNANILFTNLTYIGCL